MTTQQILLTLELVSAAGVIALVIWLIVHRRRINRALENIEQLDIDGARTQLYTAQVNNSAEHQEQMDQLKAQSAAIKTLDGRAQFLQADRIIEYEKRLKESAPAADKAERGEMKGSDDEDPKDERHEGLSK